MGHMQEHVDADEQGHDGDVSQCTSAACPQSHQPLLLPIGTGLPLLDVEVKEPENSHYFF